MQESTTTEEKYFAASNTAEGFFSYYRDIFGGCEAIYIIKGGSGTGKSRMMREIAQYAEAHNGRVEYFYCSFDPYSLDGIVINQRTAIIDGTQPHTYEAECPGVREAIVDLGAFWDAKELKNKKREIEFLYNEKKRCFNVAYSYLSSLKGLDNARSIILKGLVDIKRLELSARRLVSGFEYKEKDQRSIRLISALGKEGRVRFDSFENKAEEVIVLNDEYGIGYLYLNAIKREALRVGAAVVESYSPIFLRRPDSLLLGGDSLAVTINTEDNLNSPRAKDFPFISEITRDERHELENIKRSGAMLEKAAVKWLQMASVAHFELENIYSSAMDFERKEKYTEELISTIEF